jgi:iron(III) transport system ATP-binding protein
MTELILKNVKKKMNGFVLEADFKVGSSERIALVGRSGIGKTTLLRLIAGLEPIEFGQIELGVVDLARVPVQKREIGFVFQEQALFGGRTVSENVAFGLKMRNLGQAETKNQVDQWLEKLGLGSRAEARVEVLSGGERQRVALARAWVIRPKLILMDEPFTGLDPDLREQLCADMRRLHEENPVPLLFVTHDERELNRLANGKLIFEESENRDFRKVKRLESQ